VSERDQLVGEIEKIPDYDVQENPEIVGVEVLVSRAGCEEKVEKLEDQKLERGFGFAIEEKNYVFAKRHI